MAQPIPPKGRYELTTRNGYNLFDVSSALQKSVRRGLEDDALYWATELDYSNFTEYAWKRMRIMVSEDIGLAEPMLPVIFNALYENFKTLKEKNDSKHKPERLPFIHAVLLLVRAKKNRTVDHALCYYYNAAIAPRPIPDWAFCMHTSTGRKKGRGLEHFFTEGMKLANEAGDDLYKEKAYDALKARRSQNLFGEEEVG